MYQTQKMSQFLRSNVAYQLLAITVLFGCASQPRDSGKAANVPSSTAPTAKAIIAPAPLEAQSPQPAAAAPMSEGRDVEQPSRSEEKKLGDRAASGALRGRGSSPGAGAKGVEGAAIAPASPTKPRAKAERAAPPKALEDSSLDAQPAFAESPELLTAVADFDNQWETLSTTRACEDACRALESMKRSAKRICDLVMDGDPRDRCPTARARLEQASRDLTSRCTSCK